MAFVAVVARMPHQPQWQEDGRKGLANALEPELLLERSGKRRRQGNERVAVQREQKSREQGGRARGDGRGELVRGERAIDEVERRETMHVDMSGGSEGIPLRC